MSRSWTATATAAVSRRRSIACSANATITRGRIDDSDEAACHACKHDKHKGLCNYGEGIGTTVAICICDGNTAASRPKIVWPQPPEPGPADADTLFAAALERAAVGLEAAARAMRDAANEARIARAAALAAPTSISRTPAILATPLSVTETHADAHPTRAGENRHAGADLRFGGRK